MSDPVYGYAMIDAKAVSDACRKYLTKRAARVDAARAAIIEQYSQPRCFGLLKPRTREQAIKAARNSSFISDYDMVTMTGRYWATAIAQLEALADVALQTNTGRKKAEVAVSSDLADILINFIDTK